MFSPTSYQNGQTDPCKEAYEVTEVLLIHCKSSKTKVTQNIKTRGMCTAQLKNTFSIMSPFCKCCYKISSFAGKNV